MSRYDWERGTLTIPGSEWAKFKLAVRTGYNAWQAENLRLATAIYNELIAAGKGKRGFQYMEAFRGFDEAKLVPTVRRMDTEVVDFYQIEVSLFGPHNARRTTPLQPKKKDFPEANGATRVFQLGEASISFDEAKRQVSWFSGDNNHAVERAHSHPVARAFFTALNRVQWGTRGTSGGVLIGNDEYNEESSEHYAGGGGSYVTAQYGPAGNRQDPVQAYLRTHRRSSKTKSTASVAGKSRRF